MDEFTKKVITSNLTAGEIKLLLLVQNCRNSNGAFKMSNVELGKVLRVEDRTLQYWISHLESLQLIRRFVDHRTHTRIIRLNYSKKEELLEYCEMSPEQKMFQDAFPHRKVNCEVPEGVDIRKIIAAIENSSYYKTQLCNASLQYFVDIYEDEILTEKRIDFEKAKKRLSTQRDYTKEETNSLFQDIEDVEI